MLGRDDVQRYPFDLNHTRLRTVVNIFNTPNNLHNPVLRTGSPIADALVLQNTIRSEVANSFFAVQTCSHWRILLKVEWGAERFQSTTLTGRDELYTQVVSLEHFHQRALRSGRR